VKRLAVLLAFFWSFTAQADWTLNVGYHNPVGSTLGLNFLNFGSHWAFEIGVGWVDIKSDAAEKVEDDDEDSDNANDDDEDDDDDDDKKTTVAIGGDMDLKYLFRSGFFRPYLQAGLGYGGGRSIGTDSEPAHGVGGPFIGAGLMFGSPKFYAYGAVTTNLNHAHSLQAGLGFDL